MKKVLTTVVLSLFVIAFSSAQNTQTGYVKTKGRLDNKGQVIPGKKIEGVAIELKNGHSTVTGDNGTFKFTVPGQTFCLRSIRKNGYYLFDPDVLNKEYYCSYNPLELIMVNKIEEEYEKNRLVSKIKSQFNAQLEEYNEEIFELMYQKQITEDKYRELLEKLKSKQENENSIVNVMVEQYLKIDFDSVSDYEKRLADCILNGHLDEADSIINSKGSFQIRKEIFNQHVQSYNVAEAKLRESENNLKKNKMLIEKEKQDLAKDCYSKAEIYKIKQNWDSVVYYLVCRAELDTTNVMWQLEAGEIDHENSSVYYFRALNLALIEHGEFHQDVAACYVHIGDFFSGSNDQSSCLESYRKALSIYKSLYGDFHPSVADCYYRIGKVFGNDERGLDYFNKALNIYLTVFEGSNNLEIADVYDAIADWYYRACMDDEYLTLDLTLGEDFCSQTIRYRYNALCIKRNLYGEYNELMAPEYERIGYEYCYFRYLDENAFEKAIEYYQKSLSINLSFNKYYYIYYDYTQIGDIYLMLSDPFISLGAGDSMSTDDIERNVTLALESHLKAYEYLRIICDGSLQHSGGRDDCEISLGVICDRLIVEYHKLGKMYLWYETSKAVDYYQKALAYNEQRDEYFYEPVHNEIIEGDYPDRPFFDVIRHFPPLLPDSLLFDFEKGFQFDHYYEKELLLSLGAAYVFREDYNSALKCYQTIISYYTSPEHTYDLSIEDSICLAECYQNVGVICHKKGDLLMGERFLSEAFGIYSLCTKGKDKIVFDLMHTIHMADIAFQKGDYKESLSLARAGLNRNQNINNLFYESFLHLLVGDSYRQLEMYEKALGSYKEALKVFKREKNYTEYGGYYHLGPPLNKLLLTIEGLLITDFVIDLSFMEYLSVYYNKDILFHDIYQRFETLSEEIKQMENLIKKPNRNK